VNCPRCAVPWPHLHVTEILRRAGLLSIEWASPEAMQRGTYVHQAIALGDRLDETTLDPIVAPYYAAYRAWLRDSGAVIEIREQAVANEPLGYTGTLDAIVRLGSLRYLTDWKTGSLPASVGPQTAAYKMAWTTSGPSQIAPQHLRRACLHLRADGTYRWHELNDRKDADIFRAALAVAQWQVAQGIAA
jgi:hypothetical protein